MEGIRRISVVVKAVALLWILGFGIAAAVYAVGEEVPMNSDQLRIVYERDTGKSLAAENAALQGAQPRKTFSQVDLWLGIDDRSTEILDRYFATHPKTIRRHDWNAAVAFLCVGAVGAAILGALAWVIAGFAGVRRAQ